MLQANSQSASVLLGMRREGLFETSMVDLPDILREATYWATEFLVLMRCERDDGLVGEVPRIRRGFEGLGSRRARAHQEANCKPWPSGDTMRRPVAAWNGLRQLWSKTSFERTYNCGIVLSLPRNPRADW